MRIAEHARPLTSQRSLSFSENLSVPTSELRDEGQLLLFVRGPGTGVSMGVYDKAEHGSAEHSSVVKFTSGRGRGPQTPPAGTRVPTDSLHCHSALKTLHLTHSQHERSPAFSPATPRHPSDVASPHPSPPSCPLHLQAPFLSPQDQPEQPKAPPIIRHSQHRLHTILSPCYQDWICNLCVGPGLAVWKLVGAGVMAGDRVTHTDS